MAAPPEQDLTLRSKVLFLPAAIEAAKRGIRVDAEPLARQVVFSNEAGSITPLVWDEACRALPPDARLRKRLTAGTECPRIMNRV